MSTRQEAAPPPIERRAVRVATPEAVKSPGPEGRTPPERQPSAWDPYEIWRTRVKKPEGPPR
jgi:hypothetical protein